MSYHKDKTVQIRVEVLGLTNYADLDCRLRSGELTHIWAWAKQYLHWVEVLPDDADGWFFLRLSACGKKTWDFGRIVASDLFDPLCQDCLRIKNRGTDDIQPGA